MNYPSGPISVIFVLCAYMFTSGWALPQQPANQQPEQTFELGPVITSNFPDPCIAYDKGIWYAFATSTTSPANATRNPNVTTNIQIAQSNDFIHWDIVRTRGGLEKDALPKTPPWVNMSVPQTWAPDLNQLDDGTWVMYFSGAVNGNSSHHCIGAATAKDILGPYQPGAEPFSCPLAIGGAIDSSGFKDYSQKGSGWGYGNAAQDDAGWQDWHNNNHSWSANDPWGIGAPGVNPTYSEGGNGGQRYVVYKVDGNSIGNGGTCGNTVAPIVPTPIILQAVAPDGVTPQGPNITILDNAGLSDDGVVEAPSLVKSAEGEYVLFFSSGCYANSTYTVNYAVSNKIVGPYERRGPLLQTGDDGLYAPGGADVLWDARHIVFHADLGTTADVRQMYVGVIDIQGQKVSI